MNVKNIKKGFTLTELIIVIVIIGILAGVLIPTFINVVNKANKAADLSLIRNLNEALTLDRYDRGEHKTMTKALEAAEEFGYEVEKIDAKVSKNKILWDSKNDVFCYLVGTTLEYYPNSVSQDNAIVLSDDVSIDERHLLWIIASTPSETYSTYLYNAEDGASFTGVKTGIDAGKENISAIEYVGVGSKREVVIRTNSANTSLTINAPTDVVKHYDAVGSLNIIAVANASYHEYGKVAFVEIKTGRIALESGSEVEQIHLAVSQVQEGEKVVTKFDNITVAKAEDVTLPEFSRDEVEIAATGTLVVELQSDTNNDENTDSDYVWLFKQGVISQMVVTEEKADGIKKDGDKYVSYEKNSNNDEVNKETVYLGVSDKTDETKKAANEIANNYTGNNTSGTMTIGDETVDLPKLDANGDIEVVPGVATADIAEKLGEQLGENKTVEDVIAATTEQVATAVAAVSNDKKSDDLKDKVADEIIAAGAVKEVSVEEKGLTEEVKEEKKEKVVNEAILEEKGTYKIKVGDRKFENNEISDAFAYAIENNLKAVFNNDTLITFGTKYYIEIDSNKSLEIDLNGCKVTIMATNNSTTAFISNRGTLLIYDSKAGENGIGNGSLIFTGTNPDPNGVPGYASNLITNYGHLTIESGCYENQGTGLACYVVDNDAQDAEWVSTIDQDIILTINGGKYRTSTSQTFRMYLDTEGVYDNIITINNADIGSFSVQDNANSSNAKGTLTINNSTFAKTVYVGYYGLSENFNMSAENCSFTSIYYIMPYNGTNNSLVIKNCTFSYNFYMYDPAPVLGKDSGTFANNHYQGSDYHMTTDCYLRNCCKEGLAVHDNGDGTYSIVDASWRVDITVEGSIFGELSEASTNELINTSYKPYYPTYEWSVVEAQVYSVLFNQGGWKRIESCDTMEEAQQRLEYYRDDLYKSYGLSWKISRYYINYSGNISSYFDTEAEATAFAEANGGTASLYSPSN